ncbi:MAG: outer membrane protein assembly factor BamD [Alphaproteobacteria bacterium]|nr:outer membrane protein assembly factor BamD [Alphaproteobacteria bacterium]MBU0804852.1 outer membrane protein assembly factor BamD [Alphaproteobacteria bacterium]MBU0871799.1 outer membrane protein assembly factor BamD [Alphaproteobacteria bacterium]MBU1403552.1 outer membrane protein assembly factor BamD [Alphaproteobacteria bacterium]MBU1591528.1 outer membrane protein assembly factor BamD [Alphaproteobacteria bacterium]
MKFPRMAYAGRAVRMNLAVTLIAVAPLSLAGCMSSEPDLDLSTYVDETEPADVLYNQGLANLNAGNLKEAGRKFAAVDRQHPYSEFARKSMVMGAFTNYRQGNFDEAINSGKRYVALYPSSEDAAYAQYIVGLSYFKQIRDVTQDQKESRRAIEAMEEVENRWPESEYVEDARTKIRFARDQLAGKEMQIGRYYLERREFIAAAKRFRYVVENYSNTRHVEEALARLTETYYAMGLTSEAQTAAAVLGHNYPDSQWYKDSYALLQSRGLEPRENAGSWISQAGKLFGGA